MSNSGFEAGISTVTAIFINGLFCRRWRGVATPEVVVDLNGDAVGYYIGGELVSNKQMRRIVNHVKNNDE